MSTIQLTGLDLLRESVSIVAAIEAPEGADADAIDARLAAWVDACDDKLAAYWSVCRRIDDEDAQVKAIADRLASRRKALALNKARVSEMAAALLAEREAHGLEPREKRPEFSAWLAATTSTTVPADAAHLPPQYRREKLVIEADKTAIKAALERGEEIEGCALVTTRGVRWR